MKKKIIVPGFKKINEKYGQSWRLISDIKLIQNRFTFVLNTEIEKIKKFKEDQLLKKSGEEKQLKDFLKENFPSLNILENDRSILDGKELDIYIPEKNLAIEFNGTYWHSEDFKNTGYHLEKTKKCQEKGIRLLHIWEYDWKNIERRKNSKIF